MPDIRITVIDRDGTKAEIGWAAGQSLMEAIRDTDMTILASCGGSASCATCHVFLDPTVVAALGPRTEDEEELVTDTECFRPDQSRLSCQVAYSESLSGCVVELAPEE